MAVAMRERFARAGSWLVALGYELGLGIGIATGYATLGRIGFEGRYDYGMVGTAVIVASRSQLGGAGEPDPAQPARMPGGVPVAVDWETANLVLAAALAGLIWTIQLVHYPLFALVGAAEWPRYGDEHRRRITWLAAP